MSTAELKSYRPGSWFGIFGEHATVLLPPSEKSRVAALWELVDDGADFGEVLDALIATGLRDLPGFVLVSDSEDTTKVVLRGPVRAVFTTSRGETVEVDGSAASTWVERSLNGVQSMQVSLEDLESDAESAGGDLTISGGLVRLSRVDEPPYAEPEPVVEEPADVMSDDDEAMVAMAPVSAEDTDVLEPVPVPAAAQEPEPAPAEPEGHPDPDVEEPAFEQPAAPLWGQGPPAVAAPPTPPAAPTPPAWGGESVTDAPSPPVEEPVWGEPAEPAPDEDHDGMTRAGAWDPNQFARQQPGIPGQPPAPSVTARPVARLTFSSGETIEVDRAILVGRAPEARRFSSTDQPRLVTVPSPNQEISSTHLEIRPGSGVDHGSAIVTDMGSTNGTVLVQPGLAPEDLQPGIPVQLIPGAIVDLGDGVTISVTNP